jgi:hypothetical protein
MTNMELVGLGMFRAHETWSGPRFNLHSGALDGNRFGSHNAAKTEHGRNAVIFFSVPRARTRDFTWCAEPVTL